MATLQIIIHHIVTLKIFTILTATLQITTLTHRL